jgi:YdjC-like protein
VFSFADVVHLLANEFSSLGAGRFSLPSIFPGPFYGFLVWHMSLLTRQRIPVNRASPSRACCNLAEYFPRSWRLAAGNNNPRSVGYFCELSAVETVLDHTVTIEPDIPPERWAEFYLTALKNLKPGVTEFVIHPGYDDDELRAATRERSTWGSAWRQRDYDFFTSDQFREILAQQNIKLITWRELARAAKPK